MAVVHGTSEDPDRQQSFAEVACACPDKDFELLRELLSYDMQCPASCTFARREPMGQVIFYVAPSPLHWSRQAEWPWALRNARLESDHKCLDIGGGWSVLKFAVAKRCKHLASLEIDPEFVVKAQGTIDKLGFDNIHQVVGDARKIPYPDNWFDRVFCISVVEHMKEGHLQAVREAVRVLKPGGIGLFTMDVVIQGKGDIDFFLNQDGAYDIMKELGIEKVDSPPGDRIGGSHMLDGKIQIVVVMLCYFKPKGEGK